MLRVGHRIVLELLPITQMKQQIQVRVAIWSTYLENRQEIVGLFAISLLYLAARERLTSCPFPPRHTIVMEEVVSFPLFRVPQNRSD
jgi:hypothetical protein